VQNRHLGHPARDAEEEKRNRGVRDRKSPPFAKSAKGGAPSSSLKSGVWCGRPQAWRP